MHNFQFAGLQLQSENAFSRLGQRFYAQVQPRALPDAQLVVASAEAAALLDWPESILQQPELLALVSGATPFDGIAPLAMVYAGHQFGGYTPQLGDGRGQLLAQLRNQKGELWDVHLKGAGITPFSRDGDGCAVLRSSIREFMASEHMAALGIASTRALAVVSSSLPVRREMTETAASLLRLARSHIRFGHFEYFYYTRQYEQLHQLMDYVLAQHYPECLQQASPVGRMFAAISERTAQLLAGWQAYGFCHGVMNTDNMSIVGETFDYGPFAFLELYQPGYICNRTDVTGRYAFDQQVDIAEWNLTALGQTFTGRVELDSLRQTLAGFQPLYRHYYLQRMRARLGWQGEQEGDEALIERLLDILQHTDLDYNLFFRQLADAADVTQLLALFAQCSRADELQRWLHFWWQRAMSAGRANIERQQAMQAVNPLYVLRNSLVQEAIEAAHRKDYQSVRQLHQLMANPFTMQSGCDHYARPTPVREQGQALSCSS